MAVCKGIRTLTRNCLCSDFRGRAKPLMILKEERRRKEKRKKRRRKRLVQNEKGKVERCSKERRNVGVRSSKKRK